MDSYTNYTVTLTPRSMRQTQYQMKMGNFAPRRSQSELKIVGEKNEIFLFPADFKEGGKIKRTFFLNSRKRTKKDEEKSSLSKRRGVDVNVILVICCFLLLC